MGRKALEVKDQITLLKKRGLLINNDKKAEEYLLDIGYYRLGFYWHYFQDAKTHPRKCIIRGCCRFVLFRF